jgi:transposase
VPADHRLRKIDAAIKLEFIRERVQQLYGADNERPALDPVVLFKLLLIGYLFGIGSTFLSLGKFLLSIRRRA